MSSPHLRREDAEQYILGALSPEAAEVLERHTLRCEPCARLLHEEALLEERSREVARAPVTRRHGRRAWRSGTVAALAALAAALVLLVSRPERPPTAPAPAEDVAVRALPLELPSSDERLVACPDLESQEACLEAARERGLLVQYPQGLGDVPRYEGHTGFQQELASGPVPL